MDVVAQLIEREFEVDRARSSDKRAMLDADRFGYLSLHYNISLTSGRLALTEYGRFAGKSCEIQIRSILQHAWAEIEHDLGYKAASAVPKAARRRFSRLAGVLEIADEEFAKLRDDLERYGREVQNTIVSTPSTVLVDRESVLAFLRGETVREIDRAIADAGDLDYLDEVDFESEADDLAIKLLAAGFQTIDEVERALGDDKSNIVAFAPAWLGPQEPDQVSRGAVVRGISLFYLAYLRVLALRDREALEDYLVRAQFRQEGDKDWEGWERFVIGLENLYAELFPEDAPP